jgi:hypothetical protein
VLQRVLTDDGNVVLFAVGFIIISGQVPVVVRLKIRFNSAFCS